MDSLRLLVASAEMMKKVAESKAMGRWWIPLTLMVMIAGGCGGCGDQVVDHLDEQFREEPTRGGKVGTLRALEVAQRARQVAGESAQGGEGPCQIQWRWDRPFRVEYELKIKAERGRWERSWRESGEFSGDGQGRWLVEGTALFVAGDQLQGRREHRGYRSPDGFWEWVGPEQVGWHRSESEVANAWEAEYGGRFGALMGLLSPGWKSAGAGIWGPGEEEFYCGPLEVRNVEGWRPLLGARAQMVEAEVIREESCRRLKARFGLHGGGRLELDFSECFQAGSKELVTPEWGENVIQVGRTRERREVARLIEELSAAGVIEATDGEAGRSSP